MLFRSLVVQVQHIMLDQELMLEHQGIIVNLVALLQSVDQHGSISAAARELGLSYRHVWGELKRWETSLGQTLIVWEKGQSARLTEFGTKLMWAERQTQARLAAQVQALRTDLERTFAIAFDPRAHVLTCYASHDAALSHLQGVAASQGLHLDVRFCGSVDAIRALNEGRCLIAGFHTPLHPAADSLSALTFRPLLKPGQHKLIGFAQRSQGLMVPSGNPLALDSLQSVSQRRARLALRDKGSGTRLLFDALAQQAKLGLSDFVLTTQEALSNGFGPVVGLHRHGRRDTFGLCNGCSNGCQRCHPLTGRDHHVLGYRHQPRVAQGVQTHDLGATARGLTQSLSQQRMVFAQEGPHHQGRIQSRQRPHRTA